MSEILVVYQIALRTWKRHTLLSDLALEIREGADVAKR
jgi:hypothetical protein